MNNTSEYQICTRCVMDTSDQEIFFDRKGICNHCHEYDFRIKRYVPDKENAKSALNSILDKIKKDQSNKKYDCILGLSGGVDSSFLAVKLKEFGLRPLAVHLDNGWNTEISTKNVENVIKKLNIDIFTHVLDWNEFKDLQMSFLKASTPDIEIPTDHAITAVLLKTAERLKIPYILTGGNVKTECHLPRTWSSGHHDWNYIRSVNRIFGKTDLKNFPHFTFFGLLKKRFSQNWINLLNYIDYSPKTAKKVLPEYGWQNYDGKHYESVFTRFYQGYILPQKFGYDKRRCHLSSLVCSSEITRDIALEELKKSGYPEELLREDKQIFLKKFEITENEFAQLMNLPIKSIIDYNSQEKLFRMFGLNKFWQLIRKIV
ncbi:MAG: N-acetyl sugar amidotransferase [Candidatus Riflebacteria bacterium]|nr:N-acetyl sugar amidotransferase [Candidatus Riflebacteria bacterium]